MDWQGSCISGHVFFPDLCSEICPRFQSFLDNLKQYPELAFSFYIISDNVEIVTCLERYQHDLYYDDLHWKSFLMTFPPSKHLQNIARGSVIITPSDITLHSAAVSDYITSSPSSMLYLLLYKAAAKLHRKPVLMFHISQRVVLFLVTRNVQPLLRNVGILSHVSTLLVLVI